MAGGATDANDYTGYVQVYEFVEESASTTDQRDRRQLVRSGRWEKIGSDLMGEKQNGQFGYSLSLSQDGTILAVGVPFTGDVIPLGFCADDETGLVTIFRRSGIGSYQQLGQTLNGDYEFDEFGYDIYLSGNGKVLAVGGPRECILLFWRYTRICPHFYI